MSSKLLAAVGLLCAMLNDCFFVDSITAKCGSLVDWPPYREIYF
jgi:hypothetical protein